MAYYSLGLLQRGVAEYAHAAECFLDAELFGLPDATAAFLETLGQVPEDRVDDLLKRRAWMSLAQRKYAVALDSASMLIRRDQSDLVNWNFFSEILKPMGFKRQIDESLRELLITGLRSPQVNHYGLACATTTALCFEPGFERLCGSSLADVTLKDQIASQLRVHALGEIIENPLFAALCANALVADERFEVWFTAFRSAVLELCVDEFEALSDRAMLEFVCNLAHQCFRTEYVFAESEADRHHVERLQSAIQQGLERDTSIPEIWLPALSTVRLLSQQQFVDTVITRDWPPSVRRVIEVQIEEPRTERAFQASIERLTPISDTISNVVRQQYEENPFPRWISSPGVVRRKPLHEMVLDRFPHVTRSALANSARPEILVAGCGTGWIPIKLAMVVNNANITAVDLSLSSLSYGIRKSRQLGNENIRFGQADILRLRTLEMTFDHIDCLGALHHMRSVREGLQVLNDILKPGGTMHLGLYSRIARRLVWRTRDYIATKGYEPTPEDMRQCRQDIIRMSTDEEIRVAVRQSTFYSMSDFRDLVFHAQEICMDLPELGQMLADVGLEFLGFELQSAGTPQQYRARFPDDPRMVNLSHWHDFELDHPQTFANCYNFWVSKPKR
ncbi:MAG: class I SAM-dependent methyltransferase [Thiotrichales bacterium]